MLVGRFFGVKCRVFGGFDKGNRFRSPTRYLGRFLFPVGLPTKPWPRGGSKGSCPSQCVVVVVVDSEVFVL